MAYYKRFGGKTYRFKESFSYKFDARVHADLLRVDGYSVRVVKERLLPGPGYHQRYVYALYIHKE